MMTEEIKYTLEDLKFMRLLLPKLIPVHLIEQVKGRNYTPQKLLEHLQDCADNEDPYNLIFALINHEKDIVGYMWIIINPLDNSAFVNTISVDKIYWNRGEAMKLAIEFVKDLTKRMKFTSTTWMSTNPRFYERIGFKRSRDVAMEYKGEE